MTHPIIPQDGRTLEEEEEEEEEGEEAVDRQQANLDEAQLSSSLFVQRWNAEWDVLACQPEPATARQTGSQAWKDGGAMLGWTSLFYIGTITLLLQAVRIYTHYKHRIHGKSRDRHFELLLYYTESPSMRGMELGCTSLFYIFVL